MFTKEFSEDHFGEPGSGNDSGDVSHAARSSLVKISPSNNSSITQFGIDTLRLSLADFSIRPDNRLLIRAAATMRNRGNSLARKQCIWKDKPIYINADGCEVCGASAIWRSVETGVTIYVRQSWEGGLTCIVQFSVPRLACGINYPGADQPALKRVLDLIQELLRNIGIETLLMDARLSRVDGCFDRQMKLRLPFYASVAECLHMPYERSHRFDSQISSGGGFCLGCGSNRIRLNMYDKGRQMKECHDVNSRALHNVLRSEIQLRSGSKIREVLEMTTARDLVEQFDRLRGAFEILIRPIFAFNVEMSIYELAFDAWCKGEELQERRVSPVISLSEASCKAWRDCYTHAYVACHGFKGYDRLCQATGNHVLRSGFDTQHCEELLGLSGLITSKMTARQRAAQARLRVFVKEGRNSHFLAQSLSNPWFLACYQDLANLFCPTPRV